MTTFRNAIGHAIKCDDGRYCVEGIVAITTEYRATANRIARDIGWDIDPDENAKCPACLSKRHVRDHLSPN